MSLCVIDNIVIEDVWSLDEAALYLKELYEKHDELELIRSPRFDNVRRYIEKKIVQLHGRISYLLYLEEGY